MQATQYGKRSLVNQRRMKYLLPLLTIGFISCKTHNPAEKKDKVIPAAETTRPCDYEKSKQRCKTLFTKYNQTKAGYLPLQVYFADSLLPCWYGTAWDYNGTTTEPANGKIACGYFITTTLQHAGVDINRVRMAQCPSSELIHSVCNDIKTYSNRPIEEVISNIKEKGEGLYIAGLDFHTGFIFYDGAEVYFIHASFYGKKCVVNEKAADCAVLRNSKYRVTGKVKFTS